MNAWGIILIAIGAVMFWYASKQNILPNIGQALKQPLGKKGLATVPRASGYALNPVSQGSNILHYLGL